MLQKYLFIRRRFNNCILRFPHFIQRRIDSNMDDLFGYEGYQVPSNDVSNNYVIITAEGTRTIIPKTILK